MNFLKPTKGKLIGTGLLIIADWIAGFVSSNAGQLLIPKDMINTEAFTDAFVASDFMALMMVGIVILAIGFILKLVLFYVAISYTIEKLK